MAYFLKKRKEPLMDKKTVNTISVLLAVFAAVIMILLVFTTKRP